MAVGGIIGILDCMPGGLAGLIFTGAGVVGDT
jgi:hypothetical protein